MVRELAFHRPSRDGFSDNALPPQNVDAEVSILGGILLDPNALDRVCDLITPESFYISAHREVYRAALALRSQQRPTDLMSVTSYLSDRKLLEAVGGQAGIARLVEYCVSAANIDQHALLIQEKYLRRQLIEVGSFVTALGANNDFSIEVLLDQAEQKIFRVGQDSPTAGLNPVSESIHQTFTDIELRSQGAIPPGIACGFFDLDAMTQGFQRSDLIIVAGRPAMGKTAFALNIAKNIAAIHKLPVAIFSLEMSEEQINTRLLSTDTGIESGRLRSGRISPNEWSPIASAIASLSVIPVSIDDTSVQTLSMIRSRARRYMAESGGQLGAIVIDYLQLMGGAEDSNRVQELSRITRGLKQLARELNVPVFALSQLSRGVESRTNKRPMMSDLRESGSIEQDADLILMLYRDEYYNPDTSDRAIAEVIIAKHRNGATGTVKLLFEPQFSRFRNLAK